MKPLSDKKGIMLTETLIAAIIFLMVLSTLVLIWANSHRMLFSMMRSTITKNDIAVAIKQISNDVSGAGIILNPVQTGGKDYMLYGASNVDQSGCFPVDGPTARWFFYCFTAAGTTANPDPGLYYYTGTISGPGCIPPPATPPSWQVSLPNCGRDMQDVSKIMLISGANADAGFFSRDPKQSDRIKFQVKISRLAGFNSATGKYSTDKPFETTSTAEFKFNAPFQSQ